MILQDLRETFIAFKCLPTLEILIVCDWVIFKTVVKWCVCVCVCVSVCVSHPEGLIETVVLVLSGNPPSYEWKAIISVPHSTQLETVVTAASSSLSKTNTVSAQCTWPHRGVQLYSANILKKCSHSQECVHLHDFVLTDIQHRDTNMFIYHAHTHTSTCVNMHTYAPCKGLTRKTLN